MRTFAEIVANAQALGPARVAVVGAQDPTVLAAVKRADEAGFCRAALLGPLAQVEAAARQVGLDLTRHQIYHAEDVEAAARQGVSLVARGKAQLLMKGIIGTAPLLRAVLDPQGGLRTGQRLSHVAAFEVPGREGLLFLTDAAINPQPDLSLKVDLVLHGLALLQALGIERPRVAALAATETVSPALATTVEAAALAKMAERGQLGDCLLDGPLALDVAVSPAALSQKGFASPVAGQADLLLAPDLDAGNLLYKALVHFGQAKPAGVVMGAAAPVILPSRSDGVEGRFAAIALARLLVQEKSGGKP